MSVQPAELQYSLIVRGINTYVLPNAPKGWEGSLINQSRNTDFFGMFRKLTNSLDFVLDGAWILRTEFYTYGLAADVQLKIEKLVPATYLREQIFLGDIDFSTFKDSGQAQGYTVTCSAMEAGITAMVMAYKDVMYSIPLNVPESVLINIPPIILDETADIMLIQFQDMRSDIFPGVQVVNNQINSTVASVQGTQYAQTSHPDWSTDPQWFYRATTNTTIHLKGYISGGVASLFGGRIVIYSSTGVLVNTIYTASHVTTPIFFNQQIDFSYSIAQGERLFIFFENTGSDVVNLGFFGIDSQIHLSYQTISVSTTCRALRPAYVFEQLIKHMNDGVSYPTQSFYLKQWEQICLTSGDSIRPPGPQDPIFEGESLTAGSAYQVNGTISYNSLSYANGALFIALSAPSSFTGTGYATLVATDPVLKTSFSDFFNSMNAVINVGFGVQNNKAVLENKAYFFNDLLQIMDVGQVDDPPLEVYQQFMGNELKVGYADQTYDITNGTDEFNSEQNYTLPTSRIQKKLDLTSAYRADMYGIEFLRIQLNSSDATKGDSQVFMIKVQQNPVTLNGQSVYNPESVADFISVAGTSAGTSAYNMDLSPKRCLLRHGDYLHGILDKYDGYQIKFASALKSATLKTIGQDGVLVDERNNIDPAILSPKLFLPYYVTITAEMPKNAQDMIDAAPTGYIKYQVGDNYYTGFILDASVDEAKNTVQTLKLLLCKGNDLTRRIH